MSTIDMPETQEEDGNKDNEDKEPSDNDSALPVTVFTDPISWSADLDKAMLDTNGPVDPVGW
jgi:Transposase IS4